MFLTPLIVHVDYILMLPASVYGHGGVLCFVAVDYQAVSSEMIFSTFLVMRMCELGPYLSYYGLGCRLRASKQACGWLNPVPSAQTHTDTRALTRTHDLDHQCQAPSLFNQSHSLQWLNYWASVCSHNPSLRGSTRVFWKPTTPTQQLYATHCA